MKSLLVTALFVSAASLIGCQSSSAPVAAARNLEITGGQSRVSAQIPDSTTASATPYALQGNAAAAPAMVPTIGFQAR
jgi:hypothetical protein